VCDYLRTCEFLALNADPNFFMGKGVLILLYINDMLVVRKHSDFDTAKALIRHKWKCKDLKKAKLFVRFQINRDRKTRSLKIH
jgi:hypothetical protein